MLVIMFKRGELVGNLTWSTKPEHLTTYRLLVDGIDATHAPGDQAGKRHFTPVHLERLGRDLLGEPSWHDTDHGVLNPSARLAFMLEALAHLAMSNDEHRRNAERSLECRTNLYPVAGREQRANGNTVIDIGVVPW
ncbi:MAG TPA: hypothetical protein VGM94_01265 [Galbitalea sp.]|jgi:hypothetical protein